uniref:Uncharacterized protein n=1 Tax=Triticum urartu TaxID=4572 RepID=A0A8R7V713_TRIUA
ALVDVPGGDPVHPLSARLLLSWVPALPAQPLLLRLLLPASLLLVESWTRSASGAGGSGWSQVRAPSPSFPYTGIKQPAAWRCRPGSGGRWTRSWSWARRSSRSTTPASSSSSDVATLLSFLFPFPGLRVLMRKILLFAMGPGRWQALTCVRRCNSHTSTLPTHAIISGAKMIWCLQRSLLLHFLREKPSQALLLFMLIFQVCMCCPGGVLLVDWHIWISPCLLVDLQPLLCCGSVGARRACMLSLYI